MSAVHEQAEAAVALANEQGFPLWAAMGTSLLGWALAMQGQGEAGLAQVRQGIAAYRATGAALAIPYFNALLADVSDLLGHTEDGLQALAEALTLVEQHEERWWEAEVCRLRGVLLLRQTGTPQAEAEAWLQRALDVARRQEAKSLELRAAMSLSRLWQHQGKRDEAHDCWHRSTAGSPRALTPPTCRRPRRCWRNCPETRCQRCTLNRLMPRIGRRSAPDDMARSCPMTPCRGGARTRWPTVGSRCV